MNSRLTTRRLVVVLLAALFAEREPVALAQSSLCGQWQRTGLSPRSDHAMAFDSARNVVVMFGGFGSGGTSNRTWEWNGAAWAERFASPAPPARLDFAMGYDPLRQRTVIFGGRSASSQTLGDTWEWNGVVWTQVPAPGPSPRSEARMDFDPVSGRMILFGGRINTTEYDETWSWDGVTWTLLNIAGAAPAARSPGGFAYDSAAGDFVMFGGRIVSSSGDTWTLSVGPTCVGDIAAPAACGDGVVNIDDLLAVISAWGPCPAPPAACPANIATAAGSETSVNIDDLLAVISAWGPCP